MSRTWIERRMHHLAAVAAYALLSWHPMSQARPLTLCVEDVPQQPWTTPNQGGLNFILLARVESIAGVQFKVEPKPWRRCLNDLEFGRVDGLIGAAFSTERLTFARFPMLKNGQPDGDSALFIGKTYIFMRANGQASWDGKSLINPRRIVIAQRSYMATERLKALGFMVLDDAKTPEDGLRALVANRADVAVLHSEFAHFLVGTDERFKGRITETQQPFDVSPHYLAFGWRTYQEDPERIERIWKAIATVRRSADYRNIESSAIADLGSR